MKPGNEADGRGTKELDAGAVEREARSARERAAYRTMENPEELIRFLYGRRGLTELNLLKAGEGLLRWAHVYAEQYRHGELALDTDALTRELRRYRTTLADASLLSFFEGKRDSLIEGLLAAEAEAEALEQGIE